jgi:hypothetical protein
MLNSTFFKSFLVVFSPQSHGSSKQNDQKRSQAQYQINFKETTTFIPLKPLLLEKRTLMLRSQVSRETELLESYTCRQGGRGDRTEAHQTTKLVR